ncbi:MAG: ribose-phosphate pyrophosphokinase [Chloroflexi bacterium]|nr:ribose-phosphate pyrophosphokinase [Chloroflexota bacterium]
MGDGALKIFAGNSNRPLAEAIARCLGLSLGVATVDTFRNGEVRVKIEENVRGADVFVVQSLCAPVHHHIWELLLMLDALKRASARRITAVVPYYAYARQERKTAGREPISARVLADVITTAGADRLLTMDLHAPAIEGFFGIPVDHLRAAKLLAGRFREFGIHDGVVVSPDTGGVARANDFRQRLGMPLAIIAKQRPRPDQAEVVEMVGDVRGRAAIVFDDMISTGGTMVEAARVLRERGAIAVYACATHGLFVGEALQLLRRAPVERWVVTDTVPLPRGCALPNLEVVSVADLLAESIYRIHENLSVSGLFD